MATHGRQLLTLTLGIAIVPSRDALVVGAVLGFRPARHARRQAGRQLAARCARACLRARHAMHSQACVIVCVCVRAPRLARMHAMPCTGSAAPRWASPSSSAGVSEGGGAFFGSAYSAPSHAHRTRTTESARAGQASAERASPPTSQQAQSAAGQGCCLTSGTAAPAPPSKQHVAGANDDSSGAVLGAAAAHARCSVCAVCRCAHVKTPTKPASPATGATHLPLRPAKHQARSPAPC